MIPVGRGSPGQRKVFPTTEVPNTPRIGYVAKLERQRVALLAQERGKRGQWYWLSFVNKSGFLGGAILWAHGIETSVLRARELNISRGFRGTVEVFCEPISARVMKEHIPSDLRNRLLSEDEVLEQLEARRMLCGRTALKHPCYGHGNSTCARWRPDKSANSSCVHPRLRRVSGQLPSA
jgi:hypothetical protein